MYVKMCVFTDTGMYIVLFQFILTYMLVILYMSVNWNRSAFVATLPTIHHSILWHRLIEMQSLIII